MNEENPFKELPKKCMILNILFIYSDSRTVEVYSPKKNRWTFVASMLTRRSNFGVGVINEEIYAVGGFNDESSVTDA